MKGLPFTDGATGELRSRADLIRVFVRQQKLAKRRLEGIPMGGTRPGPGVTAKDRPYPLVCICEHPEPEWVYVAHQCKRCLRVIPKGDESFSVAESGSREAPDPSSVSLRPRPGVASSATERVVGHGGWRVPAADAPPAPEPSANTAGRGLRGLTLEAGA